MAKAKFEVLSAVEHDGKRYERGATIALEDDAAAPLLAAGVVVPAVEPPPAPPPAGESKPKK